MSCGGRLRSGQALINSVTRECSSSLDIHVLTQDEPSISVRHDLEGPASRDAFSISLNGVVVVVMSCRSVTALEIVGLKASKPTVAVMRRFMLVDGCDNAGYGQYYFESRKNRETKKELGPSTATIYRFRAVHNSLLHEHENKTPCSIVCTKTYQVELLVRSFFYHKFPPM